MPMLVATCSKFFMRLGSAFGSQFGRYIKTLFLYGVPESLGQGLSGNPGPRMAWGSHIALIYGI